MDYKAQRTRTRSAIQTNIRTKDNIFLKPKNDRTYSEGLDDRLGWIQEQSDSEAYQSNQVETGDAGGRYHQESRNPNREALKKEAYSELRRKCMAKENIIST